jgi:hypothetical protein
MLRTVAAKSAVALRAHSSALDKGINLNFEYDFAILVSFLHTKFD